MPWLYHIILPACYGRFNLPSLPSPYGSGSVVTGSTEHNLCAWRLPTELSKKFVQIFYPSPLWAGYLCQAILVLLPGKGLRYLWTIIVIADVHWCFIQWAHTLRHGPPNLTFQHWSGLTPYTSSYELAGSCVFDKQSVEVRLLQPKILADLGRPYCELTATDLPSSLTRSHPFTLAYLRLSTCVGLRYGLNIFGSIVFFQATRSSWLSRERNFFHALIYLSVKTWNPIICQNYCVASYYWKNIQGSKY